MPDVFFGHETQAILDHLLWARDRKVGGHDLGHGGFARAFAAQENFARVIALGNHSDEPIRLHDQQRADILLVHHLDRFEDSRFRPNGIDFAAFLGENRVDVSAYVHRSTITRHGGRLEGVKNKAATNLDADRKSTRLNSSHLVISYAVFCLKKKTMLLFLAGVFNFLAGGRPFRTLWVSWFFFFFF